VKAKRLVILCGVFVMGLGASSGQAQNVTITPLGSVQGEFCTMDRALLFQDPTGVRILTIPGRTVNGSTDPRLPVPTGPHGGVHVVLIDHVHADHIGDDFYSDCAGEEKKPFKFPSAGNAPEIAAGQNSVFLVGGEVPRFFIQKIKDVSGTAPGTCPTTVDGVNNVVTVPRTSPCLGAVRAAGLTVELSGRTQGVKIVSIPAWRAAGIASGTDPFGTAVGLPNFQGSESGYIIRFTNGLSVLWTGDSGLIGDWATQSEYYKVNLAVVHTDGVYVMGPEEAAYAVDHLIKPRTVIPEHTNQASTSSGAVIQGTRLQYFMNAVHHAKVIVPLSGVPISCDGEGNCSSQFPAGGNSADKK
jgi:L-ascorbate metabolism protein UlaG (beta-lactamase superfamily)